MKKTLMIICMFLGLFSANASAQLKEVRGVQTRSVKYYDYDGSEAVEKWGYELKNENNYDVWLELVLKTHGFTIFYGYNNSERIDVVEGVKDTKNITLKAGESYIWRCGDRMRVYLPLPANYYEYCHTNFYIEYKAYKKE